MAKELKIDINVESFKALKKAANAADKTIEKLTETFVESKKAIESVSLGKDLAADIKVIDEETEKLIVNQNEYDLASIAGGRNEFPISSGYMDKRLIYLIPKERR